MKQILVTVDDDADEPTAEWFDPTEPPSTRAWRITLTETGRATSSIDAFTVRIVVEDGTTMHISDKTPGSMGERVPIRTASGDRDRLTVVVDKWTLVAERVK